MTNKKKPTKKDKPIWPYWIEFRYPDDGEGGLKIYILDATVPGRCVFLGRISQGSLDELQRMAMSGKPIYYALMTVAQIKRFYKTGKLPKDFPQ